MRRGALLDLLIRPATIIQAAVFAPLAVLLLFFVAAARPGATVGASSVVCAGFGLLVGEGIRVAAKCAFAWTLPAFRRAVLREFVMAGLAVSSLATAITLIGGAGTYQTVPVFAVAFASFSLGAVSLLSAKGTPLLVLAYILAFAQFATRRTAFAAVQDAPPIAVALAGVVSALVLWGTFSREAFRWSALTGPRQGGHSLWHEWPMLVRWRSPRTRSTRPAARAQDPARYVGNQLVGGVLANYRTVRPATWLTLPFVFLVCVGVFRADLFDSGRVKPFTTFAATVPLIWWVGASGSRRAECQAMLPRSRRHHAVVAYVRDLGDALYFLVWMFAAAAIVGALGDMRGAVLRGLAVMAVFFPAFRWLSGPPVGDRWKAEVVVRVLGLVGVMAFLVVFRTVVNHLPKLVSSGATQAVVLGSLVLLSQFLHWRSVRRYLATRDLVGGAT